MIVLKKVVQNILIFLLFGCSVNTSVFESSRYSIHMQDAIEIPKDLEGSQALNRTQILTISKQAALITELQLEMDKLKKLLIQMAGQHRSERHVPCGPDHPWLPFENEEEIKVARQEAEAEAEAVVQKYTVERTVNKKQPRSEALPSHLRREERIADVPESMRTCPKHGLREIIGYDIIESLVHKRPELFVMATKYPKLACPNEPGCGIASPERPTSLVEGDKYSTSVAAAIVEAKWFHYLPIYRQQDIFAGSGWTPSRSTLLNIVTQVAFVLLPFHDYMKGLVQGDGGVGLDDTGCRMLLPKEPPQAIAGDLKNQRLREKIAEAKRKGETSLLAKMWVYSGLHLAPYNIFDFRVSRHRDGPDDFFERSRCKVQGDCFSGNKSVVVKSDGRLEFVACWGHARRKVVEATSYKQQGELLLKMIHALYDIETRAHDWTWQERQSLRQSESTIVLGSIKKWLDSEPLGLILPKSDFAEALSYIRNHWDALSVYTQDGRLPIDNNRVEQLMKQVALGRKAWLFVGNVSAGEQSAMMMSLVSSARRHDLDVWVYLKDLLDQLLAGSTDYQSLLPDVWKRSHPEAVRTYRTEERRDKADRKQYRAAQRRLLALRKNG
jgi:transposase